ncbi:MAG: tRNA pseudouridine(38-40) synthase TruA [Bacteroidaceae bacterium]|nr:tRNA pseudouridine(38-40) synthase TruA [Bacteroidaceae bacterium]
MFIFTINNMRYFLYFAYDGTNYHGWQIQPNAITVQLRLEEAMQTLLRQPTPVTGAGRTDAGVNARLMVAHFDTETPLPNPASFADRLNRLLPPDIAVYRCVPVSNMAHARFDATSRTYKYYAIDHKSPFTERYAWRYRGTLDYEAMNQAAEMLYRYTDFTSFSKLHTDVKTNNCRVTYAHWEQEGEGYTFTITADRFLRNMVRAIVGTLVEVGRHKITINEFCAIIEGRNRGLAGTSMPGKALFLHDVTYPEEIFILP